MQIKTYNGQKADFYIARVGQCGKPLRKPYNIGNCYAVTSDNPELDFARVQIMYNANAFEMFSYGTCQQAIRIRDLKDVVSRSKGINPAMVAKVIAVNKLAEIKRQELEKLENLQQSLFESIAHHA